MNNQEYVDYKAAYKFAKGDTTITLSTYALSLYNLTSTDKLKQGVDYYKRNKDLTILISAALYFFNIIDASVDARLRDFDIDDKISLSIQPYSTFYFTGLNFTFKFK